MRRPAARGARARQRGIALLLVLWACALLAILLGGFAVMARTEALESRHAFDAVQAHYAAEAGLNRAIYGLLQSDPQRRWVADGRDYTFAFDGAKVSVSATDEAGKVDLNSATPQVLQRLLVAAGDDPRAAQQLTQQIVDWRSFAMTDGQRQQRRLPYQVAGLDYGPRDGPFATVEEAQLVLGMPPRLFRAIRPVLTIWSGRATPDPALASPLALQAQSGIDAAQAQAIYRQRLLAPPNPGLVVGGGLTHSIRAQATLPDGTRAVLRATVRLQGADTGAQPYVVLRWEEGEAE